MRVPKEERREENLEVVDAAKRDVEDRRSTVAILLDHCPRRLLRHVLVRERGRAHRFGEGGLEAGLCDQLADRAESRGDAVERGAVRGRQLARGRHVAEVPLGVRERAVDEVAPVREQLVVVPADELGPRE